MTTRGRRLWIKAEGNGGPLKIFATKNMPEVEGCGEVMGYFDKEKQEIVVCAVDAQKTLFHELLHKCFDGVSGDLHRKILGNEEMIVSFLETQLYDLLVRNGWLKFPKPPRF